MKILITGASSGIGKSLAKLLAFDHQLFLVARDQKQLKALEKELAVPVKVITMDLSKPANCVKLYNQLASEQIDVVINNAGFGQHGLFTELDLDKELNMIDLNIKAVHILTKLFLKDFQNRNHGYILNTASIAGFLPGPLMATYYATKSYVIKLTTSINQELKLVKSDVYIGTLCPGPVATNFNKVANVKFALKPLSSDYVARYAIKQMFKRKAVIIPGIGVKIMYYGSKLIPSPIVNKIICRSQSKR